MAQGQNDSGTHARWSFRILSLVLFSFCFVARLDCLLPPAPPPHHLVFCPPPRTYHGARGGSVPLQRQGLHHELVGFIAPARLPEFRNEAPEKQEPKREGNKRETVYLVEMQSHVERFHGKFGELEAEPYSPQ